MFTLQQFRRESTWAVCGNLSCDSQTVDINKGGGNAAYKQESTEDDNNFQKELEKLMNAMRDP